MKNFTLVSLFVGFVKVTGFLPFWPFYRHKVYLADGAKRHLPKPCIMVSNHVKLMDFILYLRVFPFQTLHFPMAEVLFRKNPMFSLLLRLLGGIRVDREAMSFDFVSDCIELLDKGRCLGIFPQGRLPVDGKPFPFTVSTAFIASHSDAPIVPVYTDGNYGWGKRANVMIGAPMCLADYKKPGLSDKEQLQHLTDVLEQTVWDLGKQLNVRLGNEEA